MQADDPGKAPCRIQEHGICRADRRNIGFFVIQHRHAEQVHDQQQKHAQRNRTDGSLPCVADDQRIARPDRCGKRQQAERDGDPQVPVQTHTAEQFKCPDQCTEREQNGESPCFGKNQNRDEYAQSHGGCQNPFQHRNTSR